MYEFDVNNICVGAQRHNKVNMIDQKFMGCYSELFRTRAMELLQYTILCTLIPIPQELSQDFSLRVFVLIFI